MIVLYALVIGVVVVIYFMARKITQLDESLTCLKYHVDEVESRHTHISESDESTLKNRLAKTEEDIRKMKRTSDAQREEVKRMIEQALNVPLDKP